MYFYHNGSNWDTIVWFRVLRTIFLLQHCINAWYARCFQMYFLFQQEFFIVMYYIIIYYFILFLIYRYIDILIVLLCNYLNRMTVEFIWFIFAWDWEGVPKKFEWLNIKRNAAAGVDDVGWELNVFEKMNPENHLGLAQSKGSQNLIQKTWSGSR